LKERVGAVEQQKIGGAAASTNIYAFAGLILTLLLIGGVVAARL
jgi:hypothetical protein